jgi:hypothetical protein
MQHRAVVGRSAAVIALLLGVIANAACAGTPYGTDASSSKSDVTSGNPTKKRPTTAVEPLAVTKIDPASVPVGGSPSGLTVTITGSGFTDAATVTLAGQRVDTTFASSTQLTAKVPADKLTAAGALRLSVVGTKSHSNEVSLTVFNASSTLSSISPSSTQANPTNTLALQVSGAGFDGSSVVVFNGTDVPTTLTNTSTLGATVPASLVTAPGQVNVTVRGQGNVSSPLKFTITSAPTAATISSAPLVCGGGATCDQLGLFLGDCIDSSDGPIQCETDGCVYEGCM